jgi:hypothetical protein
LVDIDTLKSYALWQSMVDSPKNRYSAAGMNLAQPLSA